eukprot:gene20138-26146_t
MELIEFEDGFIPSIQVNNKTKICINKNKKKSKFISIFDDVLPDDWINFAYTYSIERNKPWGVYVLLSEVIDNNIDMNALKLSNPIKAIALIAVRSLFISKAYDIIQDDLNLIHGIAVWCLSSSESQAVDYHIDYAELYRYENNIIIPPLFGGLCHLSPLSEDEMTGGDFLINEDGLNHYFDFGYKGKLSGIDKLEEDINTSRNWIKIKYKCNRGIVFDGDYPHCASKINHIPNNIKRVILGFNCSTLETSECNMRAPEHSDAFNRTVKLYQTMSSITSASNDSNEKSSNKKISKDDILKNKSLCRLLVLAAKKLKDR